MRELAADPLAPLAVAARRAPLAPGAYALVAADGGRDELHSDAFERGSTAFILAGRDQAAQPRTYKRIALAPPTPRSGAAVGTGTGGRTRAEVANEVISMRQAQSPMAEGLRVLLAERSAPDGGRAPPAVYLAMRAMQADLLGCVNELAGLVPAAPLALRLGVVHVALDALLAGMAAMHARAVVHNDVRSENIFCGRGPAGELLICLGDFGLARRGEVAALGQLAAADVRALGRVGLMLFLPHRRPTLASRPAAAMAEARRDHPQLASLLHGLMTCQGQPQLALRQAGAALAALPAGDVEAAQRFLGALSHKGDEIGERVRALPAAAAPAE